MTNVADRARELDEISRTAPDARLALADRLHLQGHRCVLTAEDQAMIVAALRAEPGTVSREALIGAISKHIQSSGLLCGQIADAILSLSPPATGMREALEPLKGIGDMAWDDMLAAIDRGTNVGFARKWRERFAKVRAALSALPVKGPSTGIREALEEAREALEGWIAYAEENLSEFDLEECDSEALCHKCQNSGCITLKISGAREAIKSIHRVNLAMLPADDGAKP